MSHSLLLSKWKSPSIFKIASLGSFSIILLICNPSLYLLSFCYVLLRMQAPNTVLRTFMFTRVCVVAKSFWLVCNSFFCWFPTACWVFFGCHAIVANTSRKLIFDMVFLNTERDEWKELVYLSSKFFRMESLNNHLNTSCKLSHLTFFLVFLQVRVFLCSWFKKATEV